MPGLMGYLHRGLNYFQKLLLRDVWWNVVSTLSLQGSILISGAIVARIVGIEEFGIYALMMSTLMILTGVAQGSSGLVAAKFVAEGLAGQPQRISQTLTICAITSAASGIFCASLLSALAPYIAEELLQKPDCEPYLRIISTAVVFQVLIAYQYGALQGIGAYKRLAHVSLTSGLFHLLTSAFGAAINGVEGAAQGLLVAAIGRVFIAHFILSQALNEYGINSSYNFNLSEFRRLWSFALPSTLAGYVTLPCVWIVSLFVARQSEGLVWIALFTVTHQIKQATLQLQAMINVVAFSALSRAKGQDDANGYRKIFLSTLQISLAFVAFITVIFSALAPTLLSLFGANFVDGAELLRILLLAAIFEAIASLVYQLVQSRGIMWKSLYLVVLPRDFGYLAMAAIGLTRFGLIGVGYSYLIAQIVGLATTIYLVYHTRTGLRAISY